MQAIWGFSYKTRNKNDNENIFRIIPDRKWTVWKKKKRILKPKAMFYVLNFKAMSNGQIELGQMAKTPKKIFLNKKTIKIFKFLLNKFYSQSKEPQKIILWSGLCEFSSNNCLMKQKIYLTVLVLNRKLIRYFWN